MKETRDIIKSIVVLLVICLVVSAALAVVNSFTAPVSAANAAERENEARRAVIPDAADFKAVGLTLPDGVVSAYPTDTGFAAWTGTSFAAPQVVGAVAALIGDGRSGREALAALRDESAPRPGVGHVLDQA